MSANYRHTMLEDLTEWAVPKPVEVSTAEGTPFEVRIAEGNAAFFSVLAEIQTALRCKFFTNGVYGDDTDVVYIG